MNSFGLSCKGVKYYFNKKKLVAEGKSQEKAKLYH